MKRILLQGANGHLGSTLIRLLIDPGLRGTGSGFCRANRRRIETMSYIAMAMYGTEVAPPAI